MGFSIGIVYVTPGGQYILTLVDFFGAGFIAFVLAIGELAAISWIYGVDRFCHDIEFMLGFRPNFYWRWCWRVVTPGLMIIILLYTLIQFQYVDYKGYVYPDAAYGET
jgi:solute carrier family 6 (neurotransmitter transporter, glycine) member 5/9